MGEKGGKGHCVCCVSVCFVLFLFLFSHFNLHYFMHTHEMMHIRHSLLPGCNNGKQDGGKASLKWREKSVTIEPRGHALRGPVFKIKPIFV